MTLSNKLTEQHQLIRKQLKDLLIDYARLNDDSRMHKSNITFDLMRKNITFKLNVLYPQMKSSPLLKNNVQTVINQYKKLLTHLESLLMIHVDEPELEYKERLEDIDTQFRNTTRIEEDILFPTMPDCLSQHEIGILKQSFIEYFELPVLSNTH